MASSSAVSSVVLPAPLIGAAIVTDSPRSTSAQSSEALSASSTDASTSSGNVFRDPLLQAVPHQLIDSADSADTASRSSQVGTTRGSRTNISVGLAKRTISQKKC